MKWSEVRWGDLRGSRIGITHRGRSASRVTGVVASCRWLGSPRRRAWVAPSSNPFFRASATLPEGEPDWAEHTSGTETHMRTFFKITCAPGCFGTTGSTGVGARLRMSPASICTPAAVYCSRHGTHRIWARFASKSPYTDDTNRTRVSSNFSEVPRVVRQWCVSLPRRRTSRCS